MRMTHLPFDSRNPYQKLLARHLAAQGVEVVPRHHPTWRMLDRLLWQWRADGVHFHWLDRFVSRPRPWWRATVDIGLMALQLACMRLLGKRIAWTVHNLEGHEGHSLWRERALGLLVGRASQVVFVHSDHARTEVMSRFRIRKSKIAVIPHGHYMDWYPDHVERKAARAALGLRGAQTAFLFLGNIRPYKGVTELLKAYAAIATPDTVLVIAGRPMDETTAADIREAAAGRSDVHLHLGFVPDPDVQTFMKAADVVVFPYRNTLSSGALVLAMGFGRACIAPRLGGIPEMLDADGGVIFDPDADDGLTIALGQALKRKAELPAMGRRNHERARSWSWDKVAASTRLGYLGVRAIGSGSRRVAVPQTLTGSEGRVTGRSAAGRMP